ncbi:MULTISPECIES: hypothetical protein [unclassified Bartonella]|uniref:hypothetical protein n=1 Tax=unclassified Bartonella TaxID=2645622 RepID=UPI0035CEA71F
MVSREFNKNTLKEEKQHKKRKLQTRKPYLVSKKEQTRSCKKNIFLKSLFKKLQTNNKKPQAMLVAF